MNQPTNSLKKNFSWEILLLLSCIVGFGICSALLGQDINWDLKQYHFYNGYAFLHHRFDKDIGPAMVQTYINPFFDVINYLFIIIQKPILTEFLLGIFSGISAFILYKIAMLLFAPVTTKEKAIAVFFAVTIGMTGTNTISLLNTTTNDNKMGLLVILSLYFLLKAVFATHKNKVIYLLLSAFVAGFVTGLKLPAACYAIGLCIATIPVMKDAKLHGYYFLAFLLVMASGFFLVNGYWMFNLYKHFQNPLFPYYNNIFQSPYAPFFSFNLPAGQTTLALHHYIFLPFYLAAKNNVASEYMRDMRLAVISLLGIAAGFKFIYLQKSKSVDAMNKSIQLAWRTLLIFAAVSYSFWLCIFTVYRYVLPLELLTGLIIIYFLQSLFTSNIKQYILLIVLSGIFVITTSTTDRNNKRSLHKEFFAIAVPNLPENATVLLTSVPLAFVIPFFPESTRFVGMPFVMLGINPEKQTEIVSNKLLMELMRQFIHNHDTMPLYTLSFQQSDRFDRKTKWILQQFGFLQDETTCQLFQSNIDDHLKLCRLRYDANFALLKAN